MQTFAGQKTTKAVHNSAAERNGQGREARNVFSSVPISLLLTTLHQLSHLITFIHCGKHKPTFADKGCHVVSVTDPYGRIVGFLDRSRYFSIK
jgi:hypothetical protein